MDRQYQPDEETLMAMPLDQRLEAVQALCNPYLTGQTLDQFIAERRVLYGEPEA